MTRLLSLLLFLVACRPATPAPTVAPAPTAAPGAPTSPVLSFIARLDGSALDVHLELPRSLLPAHARRIEWVFLDEPFAAKPGGYADFATMHGEAGATPWQPAHELGPGDITLHYRIELTHHEADPAHGLDAVSRPTAGGWSLVGRGFIPRLKVDGAPLDPPASLRLELPRDWSQVAAGPTAPRLSDLTDTIYYAGRFASEQLTHGAVKIDLVSAEMPPDARANMRRLIERTLAAGEALFGPLPPGHRLVIYDRRQLGFDGGVMGDTVTVLSSTPALDRAVSPEGAIVVHELVHLWLGPSAMWFSEGFTRYYEARLQARLDGESDLDATRRLVRRHDAYTRAIGDRTLADVDGELAYDGGASLAYCLDTDLRARGRDLESIIRAADERAHADARDYPTDVDFAAALTAERPEVAVAMRAMLATRGAIDLGPCLQRAGYRSAPRKYKGYSARAVALEILKSPSYSMQRAEMLRVNEGSLLRPGDIIVAVDGTRVDGVADLDPLFAAARGGGVDLDVLREGTVQRVRLPIARLPAADREQHTTLVVTALPGSHAASPFRQAGAS